MDYGKIIRERKGLSKKKVEKRIFELEMELDEMYDRGYMLTAYHIEEHIKELKNLL